MTTPTPTPGPVQQQVIQLHNAMVHDFRLPTAFLAFIVIVVIWVRE